MANHHASSQIEDRLEEILGLLKRSLLKNSSTHEACLASKAIALTFINMEDISESEGDDLYRRILPSLRNRIKDSEQVDIKISVWLTMISFSFFLHVLNHILVPSNFVFNHIYCSFGY